MMRKKNRSRRGLTLAETLTALAVFAILSVVLVQGVHAAWKVYRKAVIAGEARTLQSTLTQALSDELRYARNVQADGTFDSDTFGAGARVITDNGRLKISNAVGKTYDLLGEKAYTSGLTAKATIGYSGDTTKLFTITLIIKQAQVLPSGLKTELTVQALNADAP